MIEEIKSFLEKVEEQGSDQNDRTKLSNEEINKLKAEFPEIPQDYIEYLTIIGWGAFRECSYNVYSVPMLPEEIMGDGIYCRGIFDGEEKGLRAFGDNFAGDLTAFDTKNGWKVVCLWHDSEAEPYETGQTFTEYIKDQMGLGENLKDLFEEEC